MMPFPTPISAVQEIEVTTHCNMRCIYCPSPRQSELRHQPPQHMTVAMFERALDWAAELPNASGLSLGGIGEPLMHPEFLRLLARARERLPSQMLFFSTNGLLLTDALCAQMQPYQPHIFISPHRPEKAGPAVESAKRYGLFKGLNPAPMLAAVDWCGQVEWFNSAPPMPCHYLSEGWAVIMVDGRITTCCMDASAKGVVGHIYDPIASLTVLGTGLHPFELCARCHANPELRS